MYVNLCTYVHNLDYLHGLFLAQVSAMCAGDFGIFITATAGELKAEMVAAVRVGWLMVFF